MRRLLIRESAQKRRHCCEVSLEHCHSVVSIPHTLHTAPRSELGRLRLADAAGARHGGRGPGLEAGEAHVEGGAGVEGVDVVDEVLRPGAVRGEESTLLYALSHTAPIQTSI